MALSGLSLAAWRASGRLSVEDFYMDHEPGRRPSLFAILARFHGQQGSAGY